MPSSAIFSLLLSSVIRPSKRATSLRLLTYDFCFRLSEISLRVPSPIHFPPNQFYRCGRMPSYRHRQASRPTLQQAEAPWLVRLPLPSVVPTSNRTSCQHLFVAGYLRLPVGQALGLRRPPRPPKAPTMAVVDNYKVFQLKRGPRLKFHSA
jgi:hypothetical protein